MSSERKHLLKEELKVIINPRRGECRLLSARVSGFQNYGESVRRKLASAARITDAQKATDAED